MSVPFDDLLDAAVDCRQRVGKQGRAGDELVNPVALREAVRARAPVLPAKRAARPSCCAARRLTEKAPFSRRRSIVEPPLSRHTTSVGGVSDSEARAVAVQPVRRSASPQAMIATPEADSP